MANSTVLIVDDERSARDGLVRLFKSDYNVLVAEDGKTALELLKNNVIDIMLSDVRMPGMDGLTLMEKARQNHPHLICIILTAYGDVELAVQAMQRGATDFMTKPIHLDKLEVVVKRCLRSRDLERENADLKAHLDVRFGMENMIGQSAPMQSIFETIRQVAQSRATVLIQGESGTGKELVAKAIHQLSARKSSVFVPVHCAALAENLLESELFGHEKGAFTGAMERRIGRFEKAGGGSLFLDEISEINASVQVKILRALEERQIERVGSDQAINVDTRLIAATNRDLKEMVAEGDFREDLFYRLFVVVITLPPLRDRGDDILLLLNHYLDEFSRENSRKIKGFTPKAYDALSSYNWPGNIRELRNLVERMVVLSQGEWLDIDDIPSHVKQINLLENDLNSSNEMTVDEMEKEMISQALDRTSGNRTLAAEKLGMSRRTLHRKLNKYGFAKRVLDVPNSEDDEKMNQSKDTIAVFIDLQGKLCDKIPSFCEFEHNLKVLAEGLSILRIPIILTEQLPDKLGSTIDPLRKILDETDVIKKSTFSCCGESTFNKIIEEYNPGRVILSGVEAHICVYHTAIDLLKKDIDVNVVSNASASILPENRSQAFKMMRSRQVTVMPLDTILLGELKNADDPRFKKILELLKR